MRAMIRSSATSLLFTVCVPLAVLVCLGHFTSWEVAWRAFGVTPLQPHFYDMHAVTDHAFCAAKGFDPYTLNPCDPRTPFNYPPLWLWLGRLGIKDSDATWLSILVAVFALAVIAGLTKGRPIQDGVLIGAAILSPSVMMGIERGNIDQFILVLVGGAALILKRQTLGRTVFATLVVAIAGILKLFPFFCAGFVCRFNRWSVLFSVALIVIGTIYWELTSDYVSLIRHNTPTTFILSYGYLVAFLGIDHLRSEAGLSPVGLDKTSVPIVCCVFVLTAACATAAIPTLRKKSLLSIAEGAAGTAFRFGAGIYCGTFMLGTNFVYRLMFLLLCLPQLLDWARGTGVSGTLSRTILILIMWALWLSGDANGHTTFSLMPQFLHWAIFYALAVGMVMNFRAQAY